MSTPELLNKKHINFGQGLEFLKFGQGNRGPNQQNRRKAEEKIRKNEGTQRKFDKKFRNRDPYFLFKIFLLKEIGVFSYDTCLYFLMFFLLNDGRGAQDLHTSSRNGLVKF